GQRLELLSKQGGDPQRLLALHLELADLRLRQLADPAGARQAIEAALSLLPEDGPALEALARLFLEQNDFAAYAEVRLRQARAQPQAPGDNPPAIARLDEALELAPDYPPAVVTMADIYYKEQQWEQAERRLAQVLRRMRGQPEERARLYHQLAEVYHKLGRLD